MSARGNRSFTVTRSPNVHYNISFSLFILMLCVMSKKSFTFYIQKKLLILFLLLAALPPLKRIGMIEHLIHTIGTMGVTYIYD